MLLMIGQGLGAATMSPLADRFGRKPIHAYCHMLLFAFTLTMALQPSFAVMAFLKLATGTVQQVGLNTSSPIPLKLPPFDVTIYLVIRKLLV
jgi:MFS family permease